MISFEIATQDLLRKFLLRPHNEISDYIKELP